MKRTSNKLCRYSKLVLLAGAVGCGINSDEESTPSERQTVVGNPIEEITPVNSSGQSATLSLAFDSELGSSSLNLARDLGNGIEVTAAKFNLAAIKIKSQKEQSSEEVVLEKAERQDETTAAAELEATTDGAVALFEKPLFVNAKPEADDDSRTSIGKSGKSLAAAATAKREKLAKERGAFRVKDDKQFDREVKSDKATKFSGPFIYDALAGTLDSAPEGVSLTDGSYKRIEFKLKRNWTVADDDPLLGKVFYIHGNYTAADGQRIPFKVDYHIAVNFRLLGDLTVKSGEANPLTIAFDLQKWFDGIDLATAEIDEESGTIFIDKSSNRTLLKQLHKNLKQHIKFGKDTDGDGKLGKEEAVGEGEVETGDAASD